MRTEPSGGVTLARQVPYCGRAGIVSYRKSGGRRALGGDSGPLAGGI